MRVSIGMRALRSAGLAIILGATLAGTAGAQQPQPPPPPGQAPPPQQAPPQPPPPGPPRWMTYEPGTLGFIQASAFGQALGAEGRPGLVLLNSPRDTDRHLRLKERRVEYVLSGVGSYFAQEGLFDYIHPMLGPQPLRVVLGAYASNIALAVHGDSGIRSLADLKGRRIAVIDKTPNSSHVIDSLLTFANLKLRDVKQVAVANPQQQFQVFLAGQADAMLELTGSTAAHVIAGGPKGVRWLPVPQADEAGWKRLTERAPYLFPHKTDKGAGLGDGRDHEGVAYPYPLLVTRPDVDAARVEELMRALLAAAPRLKTSAPGMDGWLLERQRRTWVIPYHDGAVRVLAAAGHWSPADQAHNDKLVQRQRVLAQAWTKARQDIPPTMEPEEAQRVWNFTRIRMLREEGFEPWY